MGAIELQVFVSLVVVLGAAFVALICDFLKGNIEQLRESNIEFRVRQDEREKREEILEKVQRHTIETLAQARIAPVSLAAQPAPPFADQQPDRLANEAQQSREMFEQSQQQRVERRREGRRQQVPPSPIPEPVLSDPQAVDAVPPVAGLQPTLVRLAVRRGTMAQPTVSPLATAWTPEVSTPAFTSLGTPSVLQRGELPPGLVLPTGVDQVPDAPPPPVSAAGTTGTFLPQAGLSIDVPRYEIIEAPAPVAEVAESIEAPVPESELSVVRIRVLSESEILHIGEPREPAEPEMATVLATIEQPTPMAPLNTPPLVAAAEPIFSSKLTPSMPVARIETISFAAPAPRAYANLEHTAPAEIRSNVVAMPAAAVARNIEPVQPEVAELEIPGGFHPAPVLARLLEEEAPFHGLAIVISVVDYVRLMAEQGKPAAEQLMGSISRLVMSLAREQDFACRIAEDEFILLYLGETGAAAKRRIQQVSERLWDFQLRSLGSVSVIFSWGASESTQEPVVQAVEYAREQMLESRRNRRTLASGVGRFRRRTGND